MGTPAMTTRGLRPEDFERVADVVDRAVSIAIRLSKTVKKNIEEKTAAGDKPLKGLKAFMEHVGDGNTDTEILQLRSEVADWIGTYPLPWHHTE